MTVSNATNPTTPIVPGVPTQGTTSTASSAASSSSAASGTAAAAGQQLSSNFDTFLQLLTTQLQNQDPLQPMDSSQFTQQLVEYSQVEQQINTNSDLQSLINLTQSNGTNGAVSYLGKSVTVTNGDASLQNGAANWAYTLNSTAATTALSVTDSSGKTVFLAPGETTAGMHAFSWNGQDNSGNQLPDGTYKLNVTASANDGTSIATQVASQGTVTEVDLSGSTPALMIGAMSLPINQATIISN